jgi:hypothetical protein
MNIRAKLFRGEADEPILKAKKPRGAKADTLHSVDVSRETRRLSNDRGEDRHRLTGESARITWNGTHLDVELVNLSGGGAMIAGEFEPMLWDRVDLHLGNHGTIECAVRWLRDDRVGLEFAHETRLDWPSDQVAIVLRHVIEKTFPQITFPETEGSIPPPATRKSDDEHRRAARHPLVWNGKLHHDYQTSAVRVRNISETGAMIETDAQVRVGSEPLLELTEAASMSATVEWAVGDHAGLRFHSPFDLALLSESRPRIVETNPWLKPAYLDNATKSACNEEEDRWGRLTLYELRDELEGFLKH